MLGFAVKCTEKAIEFTNPLYADYSAEFKAPAFETPTFGKSSFGGASKRSKPKFKSKPKRSKSMKRPSRFL